MIRDDRTLLLLTTAYPYGRGEPFLEAELPYMAAAFGRVVLVPTQAKGPMRPLPGGVTVDTSLAARRPAGLAIVADSALRAATSGLFLREWSAQAARLAHWRALERALRYHGDARRIERWLLDFLAEQRLDPRQVLVYTYWLGRQTLGAGLAKRRAPGLTLVSRAHGSDLYARAHQPPYLPFREATLAGPDRLFTVSAHGRRYMAQAHPAAAPKAEIARLGVRDPGFFNPGSADGVLRIVSCSFLERLKRVDRLIAALDALARARPERRIEWHHLGDGPLRESLTAQAQGLPPNVEWRFHGHLPNAKVLAFYRQHPLDVFVNVSASEGAPVSIMEALACGIPVVAPAIGGIPELVGDANGVLLAAEPEVGAIAQALERMATAEPARRENARQVWRSLAQAERNYAAFAARLADLGAARRRPSAS